MKIFLGSFRGAVIWENPKYISPNKVSFTCASQSTRSSFMCGITFLSLKIRQALKMSKGTKYMERTEAKKKSRRRKSLRTVLHEVDETDDVFE